MKKKWLLTFFILLIGVGSFLMLGRVKSEEEIAIELEKISKKEKEEKMDFRLNDVNKKNYIIVKTTNVKELAMDIIELEHKVTKCKIVLMLCDDENRAFNISFKTVPYSDNGICHIMEHSVLCGSKNYNVKDPFFIMAKTSMATFLNAMTGTDMTYFPISSANEQDFKNLMGVYLDAVFYPNIYTDENILKQEGWHYEIENEKDELKVNGVVLNEMKGANGVPTDALQYYILKDLYNGTSYQYNFGGVAKDIINLTQEEFLDFHRMYYSPSNAYIYLYGYLDMNERLEYMQDNYLSHFQYVDVKKPDFDIGKAESEDGMHFYDSDTNESNKSYVAYNFAFKDDKDNLKNIVSNILNNIMFYKEGSILKDKLVKMGFGEDIDITYEQGLKNGFASIIATNIDHNKKDAFVKAVDDTINDIIQNGIDERLLQSSINAMYINACEKNPGSYTVGLKYILNSLDSYSNGYGVDNFIRYQDAFNTLKKENLSSKDNIFIKRLKEMYVDCEKKCVTVLAPKSGVIKDEEKVLDYILKERKEKYKNDKAGISSIIDEYKEFKEALDKEDDKEELSKMPKLLVSDIEKEVKLITSEEKDIYGKKVLKTIENTGELVYVGVNYYLPRKSEEFTNAEKYLLSIGSALLGSLDTKKYTYEELDTMIDMYTGGISVSLSFNEVQPLIFISAKTTKENIDKAYELINEIVYNTKYDDSKRIKQKLSEYKIYSADNLSSYVNNASMYRASSKFSYVSELNDKMRCGNIAYDMFINDFIKVYDKKDKEINKALKAVVSKYTDYEKILLDCCMTEDIYELYEEKTKEYLKNAVELDKNNKVSMPILTDIMDFDAYDRKYTMEAFVTNGNVNFVSRAYRYDEKMYNGHFEVLNNIINYDYLHKKIRVEGGAYGAKMDLNRYGTYTYFSYSDPRFVETDNVYKDTMFFVKSIDMSKEDLDANIIGTIRKIDTYPVPYSKHLRNMSYYIRGLDNDYINQLRNEILDTTMDDLKKYYDVIVKANNKSEFCAMVTAQNEALAKDKYKIVKKLNK